MGISRRILDGPMFARCKTVKAPEIDRDVDVRLQLSAFHGDFESSVDAGLSIGPDSFRDK